MSTFLAFLYAAVLSGVPLLYGTLGEIITEKAGHLNLGVEGMMYMGAAFAFMGGYISGSPVVALLFAIGAGVLGALIYAFLTITLKANQNVSGLALTTFGTGVANFLGTSLQKAQPPWSLCLPALSTSLSPWIWAFCPICLSLGN